MRELTKNEKVLLTLLAIVIVGWGSYEFIILPQTQKLEAMKLEKIEYEEEIIQTGILLNREDDINKRLEALEEEKDDILSGYFPKLDQAQVTYLLNHLLEQDEIEIMDMSFERPSYEAFGELEVKNMSVSLPYEGSYRGVVDVINAIQGSPRKILLQSLSMERDPEGDLQGNILLKIYGLDHIINEDGDIILLPIPERTFGKTPFTTFSDYVESDLDLEEALDEGDNYNDFNDDDYDYNDDKDYRPRPSYDVEYEELEDPQPQQQRPSDSYVSESSPDHVDDKIYDQELLLASPVASTVLVDGEEIAFEAYIIENNSYLKLRDFAYAITGTSKQFEVSWDSEKGAINLLSNQPYSSEGTELKKGDETIKIPYLNNAKLYKDDEELDLESYSIDGNNYFKLRDLAQLSGISVTWNGATSTINIDTSL